jgi:hypothetical protein
VGRYSRKCARIVSPQQSGPAGRSWAAVASGAVTSCEGMMRGISAMPKASTSRSAIPGRKKRLRQPASSGNYVDMYGSAEGAGIFNDRVSSHPM